MKQVVNKDNNESERINSKRNSVKKVLIVKENRIWRKNEVAKVN